MDSVTQSHGTKQLVMDSTNHFGQERKRALVLLSSPIIYSMIIPAVIMDIFASIYHYSCFPIYQIPLVRRSEYFLFDRHKLKYLTSLQKINCTYCAYFNGLIGYVREIASRTEEYWCPIKHKEALKNPHRYYSEFIDYGDSQFPVKITSIRENYHSTLKK